MKLPQRSWRPCAVALVLACAAAQPALAGPATYRAICDASAAIAIGKDHFVVGEDERNVLHVYRYGDPESKAQVDLTAYLRGTDDKDSDIEGAARVGQRIYWISSHGRDKHAKVEPSRMRFFATTIDETGAVPVVKEVSTLPYTKLLDFIAADPRFAVLKEASRFAPKSGEGLNIEGLAATPDGHLLIGFRNPRPEGKALVLPLLNPAAVIDSAADPRFGDLIPLDLDRRGIRSIEWMDGGYVIVAGAHDDRSLNDKALDFKLYRWAGPGSKPVKDKKVDFGRLNPEAIFQVKGKKPGMAYVLSDDGEVSIGNEKCKDVPTEKKRFRGVAIRLRASSPDL
ncbi:DUF3616 domain-containing protein [Variovorax sp. J2P1-59]|uniref:DUF3616 domain-containing protein n=1 Tax=Variovorax flavidus TaxID=3053501 RepID=UPI00257907DF|nr:DUF3616 domain-containing protein [Variovorax sp. J2P1-59]MDM0076312.1 DUF3616 domain-containing protein [Variovorax sp. J2P1-59]